MHPDNGIWSVGFNYKRVLGCRLCSFIGFGICVKSHVILVSSDGMLVFRVYSSCFRVGVSDKPYLNHLGSSLNWGPIKGPFIRVPYYMGA